jgi:hypothetical protein
VPFAELASRSFDRRLEHRQSLIDSTLRQQRLA